MYCISVLPQPKLSCEKEMSCKYTQRIFEEIAKVEEEK